MAASLILPAACHRTTARSTAADDLVHEALAAFTQTGIVDAHVHIVGLGTGQTGCRVHPKMLDPVGHPIEWARFQVYQHASGVTDLAQADAEYVRMLRHRLEQLPVPVRALVFAFDEVYGTDGRPKPDKTVFYTPNDYVLALAQAHPYLLPVAGVHPYRPDAAEEVRRVAQAGAVAIKWLPNAQHFDPASDRCDAFYAAMVQQNLTLITHAGHEMAVESDDAQQFGNPLRLRRPLEAGVRVVVAHCASSGEYPDLESTSGTLRPAFELFGRLMNSPQYADQLYGEISAVTLFNRVGVALRTLLKRTDLHHRLIHGSDYPLPAIDPLIQTWQLVAADLLPSHLRAPIAELFHENPLLFDLVLKRLVCLDNDPQTRFPASVFTGLPPWR